LYEMLTGRRAFDGDDVSITLASVLKDDPRWQELPADLPTPLSRLLRRCLEKDPKRRLSSIGDARLEIDEPELTAGAPSQATPPARAAGAVARARPPAPTPRLSSVPPPGEQLYPDSMGVAVSPDGTMVAYVVGGVSRAVTQLWVRSLDSLKAPRIESADGA